MIITSTPQPKNWFYDLAEKHLEERKQIALNNDTPYNRMKVLEAEGRVKRNMEVEREACIKHGHGATHSPRVFHGKREQRRLRKLRNK